MSVSRRCHRGKPASRWTGDFWVNHVLLIFPYLQTFSGYCCCDDFLSLENFSGCEGFVTSLQCIMGELAGGGSVAVAVGFSDRWQVKCDMWHLTPDASFFVVGPFLSVSVLFGIGATIRTRREIQCLPHAGFLGIISHKDSINFKLDGIGPVDNKPSTD